MKYKIARIKWSTWRKIRGAYPHYKGETVVDYLDRVLRILEDNENGE